MNNLPNDPMMLFSAINMYLRDTYPSLDALCSDMQIDRRNSRRSLLRQASSTMRNRTSSGNDSD